jgi:hypothetical protein
MISYPKENGRMEKTFGNFIEMNKTQEYLVISFSSSTLSIQDRWRNNSLSADFLASYWGTFFPAHPNEHKHQRTDVQDTVSYIANELLENAIKFSYEPAQIPVKIGLYLSTHVLRFYVTNSVDPQNIERFQGYIENLLKEDPGELYLRQLELNASEEGSSESRLGFLTILTDYEAQLGWKFETIQQGEQTYHLVTTMVEIEIVRA